MVREAIADRQLDGLLVSHLPNLRYLTGFTGSNGWLLLGIDRVVIFTDGRYEQQVTEQVPADLGAQFVVPRERLLSELADRALQEFTGAKIGFESQHISHSTWAKFHDEADAVDWQPVTGLVESLRAVKDDAEVAAIQQAAQIAVRALGEVLPIVEPGMRDAELAAELDHRMVLAGAERPAFDTIVVSGPRTALPHASTGSRGLASGDLLLIDFGACWNGYSSDLTRTFVLGDPDDRQREVYAAVLEAQDAACRALRAGVEAGAVDAAARGRFEKRGMADNFVHSTGHGLGLEVHEGPGLRREAEDRLEAGMVVTVEPGLYFPGWGGIRIEDDLLVTEGEARRLVDLERDRLQALPL
ncbi:MAG: aminopeptidase P family protein [Gemmatimonadetes bacterium]|uniref:Aminopeptidase P family protein n=1 Tax=Candidatus Kutchimonas denitrificans TaxID=3056748 RepID=A0AAE4Z5W1_9BACT|nr:aminopeptidase P family protein [Gemmatimonadota bacterium]NIR73924.1 aminopeptidase P family protein [Candidatus Kutchimonas denitrificans]NIR99730.1 aminopeptidase P family protein [Gemmatimonadota bacterium]NIT65315.1 aminopeptidase P family protein [Gemmatimonadota bacterium]NIW73764.1 M24 family metallopeptidase [Gemmatimonadota bacterium]